MTKVINLYGGPSSGKSTMAHKLMGWMKDKRMNVECALEYPKDLVWENSLELIDDQLHIFGEQNRRIHRLIDKVDYVITDCPIFMTLAYLEQSHKKFDNCRDDWEEAFKSLVYFTYIQYDNVNFVVRRNGRKYITAGRLQDEYSAVKKDFDIMNLLDSYDIFYEYVNTLGDVIIKLGFKEDMP